MLNPGVRAHSAVQAILNDLPCTVAYPRSTDKMVVKIAGKYKFSEVEARHWTLFAKAAGLLPCLVKKRILEIADRLPALARTTLAAMELQGNGQDPLGRIVELVTQRCDLTVRRLAASD